MIVFPNCKINLGLHITAKRPDGYHNIETVFYPVNLKDALEILPSESEFVYSASGLQIEGSIESNLCVKTYRLLQKDYPQINAIHMHLHKAIPSGAGLGGGSADAAFTIKTLNKMFALQLSTQQMQDYCRELGSDCAFFIENAPVYAFEKGDNFQAIDIDLSEYKIVVVKPNIFISTAEAYAGVTPKQPSVSIKKIVEQPIIEWKNQLINDFEKSILSKNPQLEKIKQELYNLGAIYASMSGSGSAFYGIFEKTFSEDIQKYFPDCFVWQELKDE